MDQGQQDYRLFLDGDEGALVRLIDTYKEGLMLYLNGIVSDWAAAEELTEDTFLKLVLKKPRFSAKSGFKTWLYTIGRNVAIDHLRRSAKTVDTAFEDLASYIQDEYDLERLYIIEQRKITVHRALKKLNTDYRQVLWLLYFEDLSHAEAAAVMKKNARQMKNLVYRAKSALKSELDKEGFVYEEL